jgi:hypothetical protein
MSSPYGKALKAAMNAKTDDEAATCFAALMAIAVVDGPGESREELEAIQRANLGYFAGYYDSETRERVEGLYCTVHPIFGAIAVKGEPTPEEAFRLGVEAGRRTTGGAR